MSALAEQRVQIGLDAWQIKQAAAARLSALSEGHALDHAVVHQAVQRAPAYAKDALHVLPAAEFRLAAFSGRRLNRRGRQF